MTLLVVNADDFGQTRGVNAGIIEAHCRGIVTSTTLMANGAAFDDAVQVGRQHSALGIGVHLNLVEGRPICRPEQIPSLVGHDGSFPSKFGFFRRQLSGRLRADELHRELVAQINRVRDEGILPTHIDSHQHVHAHPAIFPVVARAAESCGIRAIRLPCERFSWRDGLRFPKGFLRARLISAAAGLCRRALSKTSLVSAETFGGTLCTGAVRADWLVDWFRRLKSGTAELMTHPGKCDDDLRRTGTRLLASRESELEALVDSRVRVAADELGIRLVHYGELVNRLNAAVGAEPARFQAG